jgi:hypothetical protein
MSNLSFFIVLAGLLFFPGLTPAAETEPVAALCARPALQALRGAQEEMTVRDTAAATGIKESTLRQLLKGLRRDGRMCGVGENTARICDGARSPILATSNCFDGSLHGARAGSV